MVAGHVSADGGGGTTGWGPAATAPARSVWERTHGALVETRVTVVLFRINAVIHFMDSMSGPMAGPTGSIKHEPVAMRSIPIPDTFMHRGRVDKS